MTPKKLTNDLEALWNALDVAGIQNKGGKQITDEEKEQISYWLGEVTYFIESELS